MHAAWWFIITLGLMTLGLMLWKIGGPAEIKRYFDQPKRDQVLAGIKVFVGVGFCVALLSLVVGILGKDARADSQVEWFAFGEIYLGLDYTSQSPSPACFEEGASDRLTSNGGFRANLLQVDQGKFQVNGKYTHHSCALNDDKYLYDGFGLEAVYRLW